MKSRPGQFGSVERRMTLARLLRAGQPAGPAIIEANPGNGDAWTPVHDGKVPLMGNLSIGGGSGWVRVSDLGILADLGGSLPEMSAEAWNDFEQGYARLSAKIRAGQTYRLVSVLDRMAVEDAFKTLDLNAKKLDSWGKIEKARALYERAALSPDAAAKVNRAARFLQTYAAETPDALTTEFKPISSAERKLITVLKRGPTLEQYWSVFASQESSGLHLNVPPPAANARPIPPINAPGPKGGYLN
jgi:hypothetical protein